MKFDEMAVNERPLIGLKILTWKPIYTHNFT